MKTIQLGRFEIVSEPGPPPPSPDPPIGQDIQPTSRKMSLGEATRTIPFKVLQPKWLPEGLELARILETRLPSGPILKVGSLFTNRSGRTVGISQLTANFKRLVVPDDIEEVKVGLRTGAFISHEPIPSAPQITGPRPLSVYWADGEFLMHLHALGLTREEAMRLAASVS